ncbi:MAG: aminotransferase class V-fold PLP-dependent enzyme [Gemmataceae bacterium]|nr:aminotransferase class V-fold PLP-dependent enzyme [Gemmataceae bacterium]
MLQVGNYVFKRAETKQELEQIHRLNYQTFVSEIPQHPDPGTGILVDKFHTKNQYLIVQREGQVIGMVSVHDQAPFSVADRLPDPTILSRPGLRPLEVRLLAVEPEERNSTLFFGLVWFMYEHARSNGYTHLFISGVAERVGMYQRLGFTALGPPVRCGQTSFVPMSLTIGDLPEKIRRVKQLWESHLDKAALPRAEAVCLLPGPVTTSDAVRAAFHEPPIYHRGPEFIRRFAALRRRLGEMVGSKDVAILNGSGTLGNEAVAANLAATPNPGRGLLLSNGEFGERLARQAVRFGLSPRLLRWQWGQPWDLNRVEEALADEPTGSWVWGVHQESSTGVLNDLPGLVRVARRRGVRVCVDCISSLGATPLDLSEVYLATGASGKSLGSYAGASLLFADAAALVGLDRARVPSYFDISAALASEGPCYTFPSPTLFALETAIAEYDTPQKAAAVYRRYAELGTFVRGHLRRLGLEPLAADECASPVVTTFAPPGEAASASFVARCRAWGFAIGGQSGYLAERRFVQIATMGAVTREAFAPLFAHIEQWLESKPPVPALALA